MGTYNHIYMEKNGKVVALETKLDQDDIDLLLSNWKRLQSAVWTELLIEDKSQEQYSVSEIAQLLEFQDILFGTFDFYILDQIRVLGRITEGYEIIAILNEYDDTKDSFTITYNGNNTIDIYKENIEWLKK